MTEAPSVLCDSGPSWERPRIVVRIKRSKLSDEFSKRLWKEYDGVGAIEKNCSAKIKGQDSPKNDEQQVDRAKFGGSSESNSDPNRDDSDGDDVGSIDSNEMASKTTHFKKTLIIIHKNAALECESSKDTTASDSDALCASEVEGINVDHEEHSNDPRTDNENANVDLSSVQQEETSSLCESISPSTSSNVDPNMSDSNPKVVVLDNTIIANPSRCSSTSSLPDESIKSPLLEQNKSHIVGKHILPTVFIPQQQNSRVAVPLNNTKSNPQIPKDKIMEENLGPSYPNITVEIDTSNDDVRINRFIEQGPPKKSTIPVRRKSFIIDEDQRKEIIFKKEMHDVLQELKESSIRPSGLELLSSVCATTRPAPQLAENVIHQADLDKLKAQNTQISDVLNGRRAQYPPIYNRSKSMPSFGISPSTPKNFSGQTIKVSDKYLGENDVNSIKKRGNHQPVEDLTSARDKVVENNRKVVPPKEANSTRVPSNQGTKSMNPTQMYQRYTANWPVENIQINNDPISQPHHLSVQQSGMPQKGSPLEYKRSFSLQPPVTIPNAAKDNGQRNVGPETNPSLFRPYTRSVSSPLQRRKVENDPAHRITKETNPHPILQPHEGFNHPTYIPDWHRQFLMSNSLMGDVMIPTSNAAIRPSMPQMSQMPPMPPMPPMQVNARIIDANTDRTAPGRRHKPVPYSPPQNEQTIRRNMTDTNSVRYPPPYFDFIPMQYPLPHPMFYNPPYPLPHPMVVPKRPEEIDQANMFAHKINQQLFAQMQNQQLQQSLIMARTTVENNQIRDENDQNMLAIYNTQTTVVSSNKAIPPEDLTVECYTGDERIPPPPYYSTHLVFDDSGEIIKEQPAIEMSITPQAELTYDQKQGMKAIEMVQPHKGELTKSTSSNTNNSHNTALTTSTNNRLSNKLQNDFLKKIQVFQKNLTSEQIGNAFPKISYSNDFRLYPHIMQRLQSAGVNATKDPPTRSTTSTLHQTPPQRSLAYPLNAELLENLLQNEKSPSETHRSRNQQRPKPTTTSFSKNEVDNNQVCTLYYESQDGEGQAECTKQTIIFTETPTAEASLQSEVASTTSLLPRNMENYNTLVKLIDSLALTEYDRLLGRTALQYYPNEVLEVTMNSVQKQMSSDEDVLRTLRTAKQPNKRVGTNAESESQKAPETTVELPEVALDTSELIKVKETKLTVEAHDAAGMEEMQSKLEPALKKLKAILSAAESLPNVAESTSKTPELTLEAANTTSEVAESTSEVPKSPSDLTLKLPPKSLELNGSSNDRHVDNLQNSETSEQLKGIPSSVIKQNPFAIITTRKVEDFVSPSSPTVQSEKCSINHENITSSVEGNSEERHEIALTNEDIEHIDTQNGNDSTKERNTKFYIGDLAGNIDENSRTGQIKSPLQDSTDRITYQAAIPHCFPENSTKGVIVQPQNEVEQRSVIVTPEPITVQNKNDWEHCIEEVKDSLVKERDRPEKLDTYDRQQFNENVEEEVTSKETIDCFDDMNSTNRSPEFENTPEEPLAVLTAKDCSKETIKEGSVSEEMNPIITTQLPRNFSGRSMPNNSYEKGIDENGNKLNESNTVTSSTEDSATCTKDISTGSYVESVKSAVTPSLEDSVEAVTIQEAIEEHNIGTFAEKTPEQDGARITFHISDTSPENSQALSNFDVDFLSQAPSEEVDAQTDSTDEEAKEFELKREAFQNGAKYLSHNFLFDIKIGPNDDIESIYARILPSCFMILNLIHEMQNINSETNRWPVDSSGNLAKIKRSLRGISIFLKRSKKLATHLDTRIHHFFIFLLQCFGTFRERVRRILDNGYALKENYISSSEADIYRDVFIQLYDYLSCTRVTDYANVVIKREESMKKSKSNQISSYQPTKPFPNISQKYMFIIKQIKQKRDAEEEKNEDYKNFISHLLDTSQGLFEDDMNNNVNMDDVIVIPDTEEVGTNTPNEPTPTTSAPRKNLKRKVDFIIIDSDSDEDTKHLQEKQSQENLSPQKKQKLKKNINHTIANIINLVDEEEDASTSEANIKQANNSSDSSNKRQSSGECSDINKRFRSNKQLETPPNIENQNEIQIFPHFLEDELPNEVLKDVNETKLEESNKQMEISQEFNKSQDDLSHKNDARSEIKREHSHVPIVCQINREDCTNSNVKDSPSCQSSNIDELENQTTSEAQIKVKCVQEAKCIPNQSRLCIPEIGKLNALEKKAVTPDSPLNVENLGASETIEAIQNYLRETDLNIQEVRSASAVNGKEALSTATGQMIAETNIVQLNTQVKIHNSEAKVIGVAMPNVKDVTCSINHKPTSINSDNPVVECPKIMSHSNEQNDDTDGKNIRCNIHENPIGESLRDKGDGTATQRLINFRKPPKKQTNTLEIDASNAPENYEPPNRSSELNHCLNLTVNNSSMLQHHQHVTSQNLGNIEVKVTQSTSTKEAGKNPSPKPQNHHVPLESRPFQSTPNSKIIPADPRSKPAEPPPLKIKARRISLESHGNNLTPNGGSHRNMQQVVANGAEDCDYLNNQAKAAISEYFDAQKIVARQIVNPVKADAAIREFDSFRSPAPQESPKYKQIHHIKTPISIHPPTSPHPLPPPPTSSKERLRQAVTRRQLSQMQQSTQTQPRGAPTPIPTLQSIYNDNIDTRGFISQYIKDEIGVLSKKESLGPGEYVLEVNTLKRLHLIPRDFKEFYIFVTKQQILQLHQPIAFYIFLELLNQSGLKDYHKKFTEYSKRKYEDKISLKKREQTHHHQQQLRHRT